jgi:hypothetical protein
VREAQGGAPPIQVPATKTGAAGDYMLDRMRNLLIAGTLALALARLAVQLLNDRPRSDSVELRLADE